MLASHSRSVASGPSTSSRHSGHSVRTRRCATTTRSAEAIWKSCTPQLRSAVTTPAASLLCSVVISTRPVPAAVIATRAVSWSRISPSIR